MANILFVDQYAALGGGQRILLDLASALIGQGHEVTALFPELGEVSEQLAVAGARIGQFYLGRMRAGEKGVSEKLAYIATALKSTRSISAFAKERGFDLMYVNGPRAMLPGVLAARRLGLPVVAAVHLIHEGLEQRLLNWCFARPQVRLVSFCSTYAAQEFPNVGAKGRVVANWVAPHFLTDESRREHRRRELGLTDQDIAVGVLGRVSKTKGQRLFLESATPLLAEYSDLRLLIAGGADFEDPQEEVELKAWATQFGDQIRFLGGVGSTEFLDSLDVSVVPSIRPESFGLVAIESMARSLPVIATRRGGLQATVLDGTTGYLVNPDENSMRNALSILISNPSRRRMMGDAGRRRVEAEYSPGILIPSATSAILSVLG